uniref:Uncharacterized protein n=1 Tax=uncultured marine microorganism HF4000_008B14 TaxID=455512 RepID=B3T128_9ZZZZ|nr:hypothetical protein ALOHA_HF4000008B14ctg1g26 [uncultured marine microorganism HF4000_008B14]
MHLNHQTRTVRLALAHGGTKPWSQSYTTVLEHLEWARCHRSFGGSITTRRWCYVISLVRPI